MPWRRCCIPRALRASLEYSVFAASGEMGCWIRKRKSLISDSPSHVVDSVGHCVAVAKVDWIRYYSIDTTWTWIRFFCAVRMLAFFGGPLGAVPEPANAEFLHSWVFNESLESLDTTRTWSRSFSVFLNFRSLSRLVLWPPILKQPKPCFPTYAQYKQVENAYIQSPSLTPRRQSKALIDLSVMFDRIWDVLKHPERRGETAQFRFWVRKMFTLSKTHRNTLGIVVNDDEVPQEVLLLVHDNLLVAVQEYLYDLLCQWYCHEMSAHGGRDKICSLIRNHYTWVPEDLVSSFVKTCPTCFMKKGGSLDPAVDWLRLQNWRYECSCTFGIPSGHLFSGSSHSCLVLW